MKLTLLPFLGLLFFSHLTAAQDKTIHVLLIPNEGRDQMGLPSTEALHRVLTELKNDARLKLVNPWEDLERVSDHGVKSFGEEIAIQSELFRELREFLDLHPDLQIDLEFVRWRDAFYRLSHLRGEEHPPDLVQVGSTWNPFFAHEGVLAELPANVLSKNDVVAAAYNSVTIGEKSDVYGVPWFLDARMLFANSDMLPKDVNALNWEEFEAIGKKLSSEKIPFAVSLSKTWNLLHDLSPWMWSAGADLLSSDVAHSSIAIDYLTRLHAEKVLHIIDQPQDQLEEQFLQKKIAFVMSGSWLLKKIQWAGLEKDVVVLFPPSGSSGSHPFIGGSNLALTSYALKHGRQESSLQLMRFMTSSKNAFRYADANGVLPAEIHALELFRNRHPAWATFCEAAMKGDSYPNIPEWAERVEVEMTMGQLFHWWSMLAQGQSPQMLKDQWREMTRNLQRRLFWDRHARKFEAAAGLLFFGLVLVIGLGKRKHRRMQSLLSELRTQITHLQLWKEAPDETKIAQLSIHENGSCLWKGERLCFDNNQQAQKIISQALRLYRLGYREISCLWGYALFDWHPTQMKSSPNALFKTAIAKINGPIKKVIGSALFERAQKTWSWKLSLDERMMKLCCPVLSQPDRVWNDEGGEVVFLQRTIGLLEEHRESFLRIARHDVSDEIATTILQMQHCLRVLGAMPREDRTFSDDLLKLAWLLHRLVMDMKSRTLPWEEIWKSMVHHPLFQAFIGRSEIDEIIKTLARNSDGEGEDPRLLQLALIWLFADEVKMKNMLSMDDRYEFAANLKRLLRTEVGNLSKAFH
ncbi:MAG: extracellular solute-binding protein [Deltaproteobacteria bacterium]|nr:extracellular solute-binding protein [Deltaproteobacteria bacterium]